MAGNHCCPSLGQWAKHKVQTGQIQEPQVWKLLHSWCQNAWSSEQGSVQCLRHDIPQPELVCQTFPYCQTADVGRRKTLSMFPGIQVPGWSPVRYHLRLLSSKYDKPDPLLLWTGIVLTTSSTKLNCFTPTWFRPFTETLFELGFFCCFLLPREQNFLWRGHSQNTKIWHFSYQCSSRRELPNFQLKETGHSKTHHPQDPPWNILNQEQLQLKFSLSSEPWGCRSVVSWVNQTGRKHGIASLL